ncbi:MAG: FG-GAP-like repeat-containing protein [Leptospirales bacterium]
MTIKTLFEPLNNGFIKILFISILAIASGFCTTAVNQQKEAGVFTKNAFGPDGNKGAVTLLLTDFPIQNKDVTSVMVNFRSIEVNSATEGWMTVVDFGDAGKTFDLLQLQNGVTAALGSFSLDPGTYDQMRFVLNDANYLNVNTKGVITQEPLKTPSGGQTGIKLIHSFTVDSQGYTVLTIDFDAQKSIHYNKGQGFMLKPVIKVIDAQTTPGAGTTINAATGGSTGILNEIMLDIPAGVLNADTNIEILPLKGTPYGSPFSGMTLLSNRYELLPDGTLFNGDITITMNYDPAEVTTLGLDASTLEMLYYDDIQQDWVSIGGTVNLASNTVTATVNHFTPFALGGNSGSVVSADIINAGVTITQVPESVTATITPKQTTTTVNTVTLAYLINGISQPQQPMVLNVATGLYEASLPAAPFYPDVINPANVQMCIHTTETTKTGKLTYSFAPAGCDPLVPGASDFVYSYNPDAEIPPDLMNDRWEFDNGLNPAVNDGAGDLDGDLLTNVIEYQNGTNPNGFDATVGGTVTGLALSDVLVIDNNGENLSVTGGGTGSDVYEFLGRVLDTAAYNVTVITQPTGKTCTITGGTGNVAGSHVSVAVDCVSNRPKIQPGIFADNSPDHNYSTYTIAMGDVDGDGDIDRVEGNWRQPNKVYLNDGTGIFIDSGQNLGTDLTTNIFLGDLDNDGDLDLVTGNSSNSKVYINDGTGTFVSSRQIASYWTVVALADLDNDGDLDLFATTWYGAMSFFMNNGSGVFSQGQTIRDIGTNISVALGDIDNDGDLDIIEVKSVYVWPNKIYLNDGTGNFVDSGQTIILSGKILLEDVDGDGALDIIEMVGGGRVTIYINDGTGNFVHNGAISPYTYGGIMATGDVDGDGDLDIVIGASYPGSKVLLNDGTGVYIDSGQILDTGNIRLILLADVNGDGNLDIATANIGHDNKISLNDGMGNFTDTGQTRVLTQTMSVSFGDINNDGYLDLVEGGYYWNSSKICMNDGLTILIDNCPDFFAENRTSTIALADFDNDGDLDIVEAINGMGMGYNKIYFNDGLGNYTDSGQNLYPVSSLSNKISILTGDLDGDNDVDFIISSGSYSKVHLNDGTGGFNNNGQIIYAGYYGVSIALGDIDGDGDPDLVQGNGTIHGSGQGIANSTFLNDGSGMFTKSAQSIGLSNTVSVAFGDVDGDGDLDLVEGNKYISDFSWGPIDPNNGKSKIYLNNGSGVFTDSGQYLGKYYQWMVNLIILGDVDDDGDLDIVESNNGAANKIYFNDGLGVFTDSGQALGIYNQTTSLDLGDIDNDGDLDLIEGNSGQPNNIYYNLTY